MTRLLEYQSAPTALDPLAEAVALLDFTDSGQFHILDISPPKPPQKRPARIDRSPDALMWFATAECQ